MDTEEHWEFDPEHNAESLYISLNSKEKEKTLIEMIVNTTNEQRQLIKEKYNLQFNRDLIIDLEKKLHGDFKNAVLALFYNPIDYDCIQLRKAVKGLGTDEDSLIEILSTRSSATIEKIKKRYEEMYPGRDLIKDIEKDTSGHFRKLLVALLSTKRNKNSKPDLKECDNCARELYEAGEKKWGTNENVFTDIFTQKSNEEFSAIAQFYYHLTSHTILHAVESEFSGDSKKCLTAIIYAIISPSEFFARKVNQSVKGLGTDDNLLIRVLVTRREKDLPSIKQFYEQIFKKSMIEDIKDDTSGYYRELLVKIASG